MTTKKKTAMNENPTVTTTRENQTQPSFIPPNTLEVLMSIANDPDAKGPEWVEKGSAALVTTTTITKEIESKKEEESRAFKTMYDESVAPFNAQLKKLAEVDTALRSRMLVEHEDSESFMATDGDNLAEIVFVSLYAFNVVNVDQVPPEYLTVDSAKVRAAIKDGRRNIPGLNIYKNRTLQVRMK